jgi:hypothetical protein
MPEIDLSTNDIEMYQTEGQEKKDDSHIDYKRIDEVVEASQKLYPDMDRFILWVMAADYWLKEEYKPEISI